MNDKRPWLASLIAGVIFYPTTIQACEEQEIPLTAVPEHVLAAAESALSGVQLIEAELVSSDSLLIYELEGLRNDTEYEIFISHEVS